MPGGSKYQGPAEALERYTAIVDEGPGNTVVKGAKNPYTSRNGHMFSFLDAEGRMALRLSDELREEFAADYDDGPVLSYGSVMRGYVYLPEELMADVSSAAGWFAKSHEWIGTLEPKPTKK